MYTDITVSAKPENPVIDRNPPFTKVVSNLNALDYFRFVPITAVSITVGYLSSPLLSLYIYRLSEKPENPVIDRNPPFTKVVSNLNTLDYFRFVPITAVSITVGYLSGKPGIRGPSMVTEGLMGGFM